MVHRRLRIAGRDVVRLARLLETPRDIPVLALLAMREFHYRLLISPYGPAIAQMANMSPSSFHQHFRAVTAMSTIQYQKRPRLTEARM
jgi:AraC-like DNA-binding protein